MARSRSRSSWARRCNSRSRRSRDRSSSTRLRSVMSCAVPAMRTGLPSAFFSQVPSTSRVRASPPRMRRSTSCRKGSPDLHERVTTARMRSRSEGSTRCDTSSSARTSCSGPGTADVAGTPSTWNSSSDHQSPPARIPLPAPQERDALRLREQLLAACEARRHLRVLAHVHRRREPSLGLAIALQRRHEETHVDAAAVLAREAYGEAVARSLSPQGAREGVLDGGAAFLGPIGKRRRAVEQLLGGKADQLAERGAHVDLTPLRIHRGEAYEADPEGTQDALTARRVHAASVPEAAGLRFSRERGCVANGTGSRESVTRRRYTFSRHDQRQTTAGTGGRGSPSAAGRAERRTHPTTPI